jgi:hypothetical protein
MVNSSWFMGNGERGMGTGSNLTYRASGCREAQWAGLGEIVNLQRVSHRMQLGLVSCAGRGVA